MQPITYTPTTNFADDERNNVGGRATVRADKVDAEYAAIAVSLNQIIANIGLIQRDDGELRDGIIDPYSFSAATKAFFLATKWNARGLWVFSTVYAVNDLVDFSGAAYVCAIAHTSGVFATDYAAGRWQIFSSVSTASTVTFSPTSSISSIDVQAAIVAVDAKVSTATNPLLSTFYGGL